MSVDSDLRRIEALQYKLIRDERKNNCIEWDPIEEGLGLALPKDYKLFLDTYGVGGFAEFGFLDPNDWRTDPKEVNRKRLESLLVIQRLNDFHSIELWPEPMGLLCFGRDTNAGTFAWSVSINSEWSIVYAERDWDQILFIRRSFIGFLQGLLVGNIMPTSMINSEYWSPTGDEIYQYRCY